MKIKMVAFPNPVSKLYYNWGTGIEKHGDSILQLSPENFLKALEKKHKVGIISIYLIVKNHTL